MHTTSIVQQIRENADLIIKRQRNRIDQWFVRR
jgi:hypothetical protein